MNEQAWAWYFNLNNTRAKQIKKLVRALQRHGGMYLHDAIKLMWENSEEYRQYSLGQHFDPSMPIRKVR